MAQLTPFRSWLDEDAMTPWPSLLTRLWRDWPSAGKAEWLPTLELDEKPECFVVKAELPGIAADEVRINLTGDSLSIRGEKRTEERGESDNRHFTERRYGAFERRLTLPAPVTEKGIDARLNDGVLTITIEKAKQSASRRIQVKQS